MWPSKNERKLNWTEPNSYFWPTTRQDQQIVLLQCLSNDAFALTTDLLGSYNACRPNRRFAFFLLWNNKLKTKPFIMRIFTPNCVTSSRYPTSQHRAVAILPLKARFHYERGKEHFFFLLLIFGWSERLKLKRAQKKSIKQTKNALFHARSGNGPLFVFVTAQKKLLVTLFRCVRCKNSTEPTLPGRNDDHWTDGEVTLSLEYVNHLR